MKTALFEPQTGWFVPDEDETEITMLGDEEDAVGDFFSDVGKAFSSAGQEAQKYITPANVSQAVQVAAPIAEKVPWWVLLGDPGHGSVPSSRKENTKMAQQHRVTGHPADLLEHENDGDAFNTEIIGAYYGANGDRQVGAFYGANGDLQHGLNHFDDVLGDDVGAFYGASGDRQVGAFYGANGDLQHGLNQFDDVLGDNTPAPAPGCSVPLTCPSCQAKLCLDLVLAEGHTHSAPHAEKTAVHGCVEVVGSGPFSTNSDMYNAGHYDGINCGNMNPVNANNATYTHGYADGRNDLANTRSDVLGAMAYSTEVQPFNAGFSDAAYFSCPGNPAYAGNADYQKGWAARGKSNDEFLGADKGGKKAPKPVPTQTPGNACGAYYLNCPNCNAKICLNLTSGKVSGVPGKYETTEYGDEETFEVLGSHSDHMKGIHVLGAAVPASPAQTAATAASVAALKAKQQAASATRKQNASKTETALKNIAARLRATPPKTKAVALKAAQVIAKVTKAVSDKIDKHVAATKIAGDFFGAAPTASAANIAQLKKLSQTLKTHTKNLTTTVPNNYKTAIANAHKAAMAAQAKSTNVQKLKK